MKLSSKEEAVLDLITKGISYENYFFRKVKDLKWFYPLKDKNYFKPEKVPVPELSEKKDYYRIPYWNVLDYLEKLSEQKNLTDEYIKEILNIIKEVTNYFKGDNNKLDNYKVWWMFISIVSNLPKDKIKDEILDLIPYWINSKFGNDWQINEIIGRLLPKFIEVNNQEDINKAEKILKYLLEIKWVPGWEEYPSYKNLVDIPEKQRTEEQKNTIRLFSLDKEKPKLIFDQFLLIPEKVNLINKLGKKCSKEMVYWLADEITKIFEKEKYNEDYDLTLVWVDNIININYGYSDVGLFLIIILRELLSAKSKENKDDIKEILNKFIMNYKYPVFKRLIIYVVNKNWTEYKEIFWKLIENDKGYRLFNRDKYSNDLYYLFLNNSDKLAQEDKEKIKYIIENHVPDKDHSEEEHKEYYRAYKRQKFYQALKSDEYFKPLYDKCGEITKTDIEPTSIRTYSGPGISPKSKENMIEMSNKDLVDFFIKFKNREIFNGPSINGLSQTLKEAVIEKPEKFYNDLLPFLKSPYRYVYYILFGFTEVLSQKKVIDWKKIIDFINKYIEEDDFWNDKYKIDNDDADHLWVIGNIGYLIMCGLKENDYKITEKYYSEIFEILTLTLEKMEFKKEINNESDYFLLALNSALGKVLEALVILVQNIHVNKEENNSADIRKFIEKYDSLLNYKNIEAYVWFGTYLPIFYDLDKIWTEKKVNDLLNLDLDIWESFITGCSYNRNFFELYDILKPHYQKLVNYKNESLDKRQISKRIIDHICIWYLKGKESIENKDTLFRQLIDRWDKKQITDIIGFFWMQRIEDSKKVNEEYKSIKEKIIYFWEWIYENKFKEKFDESESVILSELSKLIIFLDEINHQNCKWLKQSTPFVMRNFNYYFFIEYLDSLKYKGDKEIVKSCVGEIYIKMLEGAEEYPQYPTENIESIIKFLYISGNKKDADDICSKYAEKGCLFLKKIYDKFNS